MSDLKAWVVASNSQNSMFKALVGSGGPRRGGAWWGLIPPPPHEMAVSSLKNYFHALYDIASIYGNV